MYILFKFTNIFICLLVVTCQLTAQETPAPSQTKAYLEATELKDYATAFFAAQRAYKSAKKSPKLSSKFIAPYAHNYGKAAYNYRDRSALKYLEEAIRHYKKQPNSSLEILAELYALTADEALMRKNTKTAYQYFLKSIELSQQHTKTESVTEGFANFGLAKLYLQKNYPEKAYSKIKASISLLEQHNAKPQNFLLADALTVKGEIATILKHYAEAEEVYQKAYALYKKYSKSIAIMNGEKNTVAGKVLTKLLGLAHLRGDEVQAEAYALEYARIRQWVKGYPIYSPMQDTVFASSANDNFPRKKIKAAYRASYQINEKGRAENITVHTSKNISEEHALKMLTQAYFAPKLANGIPVKSSPCNECEAHFERTIN